MRLAHPAQHGNVRGRRMLANVLESKLVLEEAAILGLGPCELVLFEIAAAFPSAE